MAKVVRDLGRHNLRRPPLSIGEDVRERPVLEQLRAHEAEVRKDRTILHAVVERGAEYRRHSLLRGGRNEDASRHRSETGTLAEAGAVELRDLRTVEVELLDRVLDRLPPAVACLHEEPRRAAVRRRDRIEPAVEIPSLHLENGDADPRVEEDEVGAQPIEVRLHVDLPIGAKAAVEEVEDAPLGIV